MDKEVFRKKPSDELVASTTASPRLAQGVVLSAPVSGGAIGACTQLYRGPTGDARGSGANGLISEFLGDYSYASALRTFGVAVWNDVREAPDCPAIDAYRQALATGQAPTAPEPNNVCPQTDSSAFGHTDIWGSSTAP